MVVLHQTEEPITAVQDSVAEPTSLPPHREYDHTMPLVPGAVPINTEPYRYSPLHKDEIERQVKTLLQSGLIVPNTSLFASPVLLVQKKDDSWCFYVDYKRLNSLTIKSKFPMLLVDEILDELTGSQFFNKLDFNVGFHQVRMTSEDEFKITFKTHHNHYQFKVMPFEMNHILEPFL
jgi:hypothetical protein